MCVCVCVCVCACEGRGINFQWYGGATFWLVVGGLSPAPHPPSEENFAIPDTKLVHKTLENIRLNYKMYYKSVIIHKNRIFPYFQNEVKNFHKYNNIIVMIIIG